MVLSAFALCVGSFVVIVVFRGQACQNAHHSDMRVPIGALPDHRLSVVS